MTARCLANAVGVITFPNKLRQKSSILLTTRFATKDNERSFTRVYKERTSNDYGGLKKEEKKCEIGK